MSKAASEKTSADEIELEPWLTFSKEDVRRAWLDLQEFLRKRRKNEAGHRVYTYDEALGQQLLTEEWRRRRTLYLITKPQNDEAP